jgi:hypothetical protein
MSSKLPHMSGWDALFGIVAIAALVGLVVFVSKQFGPRIKRMDVEVSPTGGMKFHMSTRSEKNLALSGKALVDPEPDLVRVDALLPPDPSVAPAGVPERRQLSLEDSATVTEGFTVIKVEPTQETPPEESEDTRRAQLELVINSAAEWGWTMARLGVFKSFPNPIVEWDNGIPSIDHGRPDDEHVKALESRASTASLEIGVILSAAGEVSEPGDASFKDEEAGEI